MRFILPATAVLLAADKDGGAGGAAPAPKQSIADQLSGAQARVTELEGLQAAWNGEKASLTSERDTAAGQVTTLQGQLSAVTTERDAALVRATTAESQMTTLNGQITTLTAERDAAVALSKNPSAQAQAILATAGAPAVVTTPNHTGNPAATKMDVSGLTGLDKAIALRKAQAGK